MNFTIAKQHFDLVIIGSGGAGLMSAISAVQSGLKNIAVISKVIPTNSHTVAAKGGINAPLGNAGEDDWQWHAYDTLKGSDYLADSDAVEILCKNASEAIIDLERMGVVFSRDQNGKIAQRAYGGQTLNFGNGGIAHRACYSKDKTGHTILHALYQECVKRGVRFFSEFLVMNLLIEDKKRCYGCLTLDLNSGELVTFSANNTILATGGYSQIYRNTTSSLICTGDGSTLVFEEGLPLQDMEFTQFHPTGIYGHGFLVTEAARGEGGYLINASGDRFMKKYSPKMIELASRDVVSQAIATEIKEGRGVDGKDFVHLDLRHLSEEVLHDKLPGVVELIKNFAALDAKKDLIPVAPSAHYSMGGIPTSIDCFVVDENGNEVDGLMAVGEAACVSVHGANRLGCNSLLDLIVFGKIAGKNAKRKSSHSSPSEVAVKKIVDVKIAELAQLFEEGSTISLTSIKKDLKENNEKNLGVFRNKDLLELGLSVTQQLFTSFKKCRIANKGLIWNGELVEYFELKSLLLNSLASNFSALNRQETRGSHYRSDFTKHDDQKFLCHSVVSLANGINDVKMIFSTKKIR